jgi:hypothetical protein
MNKYKLKLSTIIFLIILFLLPGVTALFFYKHQDWLSSPRTNKGELLSPAIKFTTYMESPQIKIPSKGIAFDRNPKWKLILWEPGRCNESCIKILDKLARIRLALGRRLYQVDVNVLSLSGSVSDEENKQFQKKDIHFLQALDSAQLSKSAKIYLMDSQGYLILAYPTDFKAGDIYKDLKHLLTVKEQIS